MQSSLEAKVSCWTELKERAERAIQFAQHDRTAEVQIHTGISFELARSNSAGQSAGQGRVGQGRSGRVG